MFFDPLSSWLVVLIADGVILANEKIGINSSSNLKRQGKRKWVKNLNGQATKIC